MSSSELRMIGGLEEIADRFDACLLDLWGLVHDGQALYPGVSACLDRLQAAGKRVIFVSNSPNRSQSVARKLAGLGIHRDRYEAIVTAGEMTHQLLREGTDPQVRAIGRRLYDLDGASLAGLLKGVEAYEQVADPSQADGLVASVVNLPVGAPLDGYDGVLRRAADRGLPLLCVNPDRVVVVGEDMYLCPGALADRYEALGGQSIRIGKPYPHVYALALRILGDPARSRVLAAGDSLATDVAGAQSAGLPVLFNLTGIHAHELGLSGGSARGGLDPKPDLDTLRRLLAAQARHPDYVIAGLRWA